MSKLTKPARVGNTIFGEGVDERLVIERAYREHEYHEADKDAAPWEKNGVREFVDAVNAARPEERAHKCKARETIEYAITLLEVHGGNPKVIEYLRAGLDQHEAAPPMNSGERNG